MISSALATVNLFKVPVRLRINRNYFLSSRTGEIMSALIFVYLIYNFVTSDAFTKQNPLILQTEIETLKTSTFNFTKDNFAVMVGIASLSGFAVEADPRYVRFYAEYALMAVNPKTKNYDSVSFQKILMPKCKDSFMNIKYPELVNQFPGSSCLPNTTFSVYGSYSEPKYQFMEISVEMCNNKTMNNTCKTVEEINAFVNGKFLGIVQTENLFAGDNHDQPFQSKMTSRFFSLDGRMRKMFKASLATMTVIDNDGLFVSNSKSSDTWKISENELDIDLNSQIQLASILYMSTNKGTTYSRTYMKLQGELGSLGGITNIFICVGVLLMSLSPIGVMEMFLSKHLFTFQNLKSKNEPKEKRENKLGNNKITLEMQETVKVLGCETPKSPTSPNVKLQSIFLEDCKNKDFEMGKSQKSPVSSPMNSPKYDRYMSADEGFKIISPNSTKRELLQTKILDDNNVVKVETQMKPLIGDQPILLEELSVQTEAAVHEGFQKKMRESIIRVKGTGSNLPLNGKRKTINQQTSFAKNFLAFSKHKNQKDAIKLGFRDLLNKDTRIQFLKKIKCIKIATSKINNDLDIITILQRFQELDKLKLLLLNKDQLMLFNLIAKPEIFIDEKDHLATTPGLEISKNLKNLNEADDKRFLELAVYYNNIKKKKGGDDLDSRLVKLLDNDMKEYFEL